MTNHEAHAVAALKVASAEYMKVPISKRNLTMLADYFEEAYRSLTCPDCEDGYIYEYSLDEVAQPCPTCNGEGWIE